MADPQVAYRTSDFDYDLPPELIAQVPSARRGDSRLLVVRRAGSAAVGQEGEPDQLARFSNRVFRDLPELIPPGDLLVINTTKVRHARLLGRRSSASPAEVLLLYPADGDTWVAMGKPGNALKAGKKIDLGEGIAIETVEELEGGYRRIRVLGASAEEAMVRFGRLPLPPYIHREPASQDAVRYQTVFADREGSAAAPTAGLHFTRPMLRGLEARGVRIERLDLEVGPGTFRPVEEEDYTRHPMHPERYLIPRAAAAAVEEVRARGGAVWAVGTTVVRALESAAGPDGTINPGAGETRLMITPGYRFRVVDRMITNFHLPRSTLLMLVSAFAGYEITKLAYGIAVGERYRFYSYGDAMAIL